MHSFYLLPFLSRVFSRGMYAKLSLLFCSVLLFSFLPFMIMTDHGLDNAVEVGAFVDGVFPPTATGGGGGGSGDWLTEEAFPNLSFFRPMHLLEEPGTNRIWVAEHSGAIYSFPHDENAASSSKTLVVDLSSQTHYNGESGLLGFAFHPKYGNDSNYVYIFYQTKQSGNKYSRISRFTVPSIPGTIDMNSELILIQQRDRGNNHNGGGLFFGNDGFLYISTGDEGGGNNTYDNGQYLDKKLFGGVLRIDVDRDPSKSHSIRRQPQLLDGTDESFTDHYFIPNDNPWLDTNGGYLEEFYALGFRNPHRMTYDAATSRIWVGDVGQSSREEVDVVVKGGNYQWSYKEGTQNGPDSKPASIFGTDEPPTYEYSHSDGNSIIGGYVYRGPSHSDIQGHYLFSDYGSKRLWALDYNPSGNSTVSELMTLSFRPSAFGIDLSNEVYILNYNTNSKIYKLVRQNPGSSQDPPQLLSQTGVFQSLEPLVPEDFAIPFELNAPFWSDGATKYRWMIIPNNGSHNSTSEQISYSEEGEWEFPQGAVLVKHFEMPLDENNANITRKLETRFLIHGTDGNYYGLTYRWNEAQDDAVLLADSKTDTLSITTPSGTKKITWYYPSRGECLNCHNESTKGAIGPLTRQLNKEIVYPVTGRTANQLKTLSHLNIFDSAPDTSQLSSLMTSSDPYNPGASLEDRARSYLDINCASCHQPGAGIGANFDTRLSTSLDNQGLIYANPVDDLGISGGQLIVPGNPEKSILYHRINSVHSDFAMPQLAKNILDTAGVSMIENWINSIPQDYASSSCPTIEFDPAGINSYVPSQDQGTASVENNGQTLLVQNNGWKYIDYPYTITSNTVLEFDFRSTIEGEEHSIGLDDDNTNNGGVRRFKLFGTQTASVISDFDTYNGSGNDQHYVIPIGSYYTGIMDRIFFVSDHDDPPSNGNSYFSNVSIHEGNCSSGSAGQSIDFPQISTHYIGDSPINLQASASSGLPVTFQVMEGPATISGNTLSLTGQTGPVRVRADQEGDGTYAAAASVDQEFWVFPAGKDPGSGLNATYYDKKNLSKEAFVRIDSVVNFYWGSEAPGPGMEYDTWSVAWEGEIEIPYSETFTFTTSTDDGIRLWVNNQLIIDQWNEQSATEFSGSISLNAWERVPIRMEYYQEHVYASASLSWNSTSLSPQIIPTEFLYPSISTGTFPVELLSFEAIPESNQVLLRWSTASEQASDKFLVEHSVDGVAFQSIDEVLAAGYSNVQVDYETTDQSPEIGINYYRLKQIDTDGTFTYSQVEEVIFVPSTQMTVYPNPLRSGDGFSVELHDGYQGMLMLKVHNSLGQSVIQKPIEHYSSHSLVSITTEHWEPGIYFISIAHQQEVIGFQKLVVH